MIKFFDSSKKFIYRENQVKFRTRFARIIRSQAVDHIRRNRRAGPDLTDNAICDPFAGEFLEEWRKIVLAEAMDEVNSTMAAKTFQAFELYGCRGVTSMMWQKSSDFNF